MRPPLWLWLFLAGALLLPGRPLWGALWFLGGLYLVARLSLGWALGRLSVERRPADSHLFAGERLMVTLRLTNRTGAPLPWLRVDESRPVPLDPAPHTALVRVDAGEVMTVSYALDCHRRGRYRLGPLALAAGDPFGFLRAERRLDELTPVTVYPRLSSLPDLGLPARLPLGDLPTRRRLFEDPAWLAGTRPYVPGDSLRRIHWGATAKTGELAVKQFRHAMLLPAAICLNLNRDDYHPRAFYPQVELAVGGAASLTGHLLAAKQQVALMVCGRDPDGPAGEGTTALPLRQGDEALAAALELLARVESAPTPPFVEAVAAQARQLPWGTLLCLITPVETPALAALSTALSRGGRPVLLFVLDGESGPREGYQVFRLHETREAEVVVG